MNNVAAQYINGLKKAYFENDGQEVWEDFERVKQGATPADIIKLKEVYPDAPDALISLLEFVDGTYWRKYGSETINFFFLGSDMFEYPYYLLSSQEIGANEKSAAQLYSQFINHEYDGIVIDEKIANQLSGLRWLHFSDCMNNGGTSQLFIDFSPSEKGKNGQVIRFVHDPDEFMVIADSFEDYLKMLMKNEYNFTSDETME